ncbi:GerAB/ArcD/ProY family transporter [Clostridium bovifaecis]|uniref:GerAB/ArcD/ProY family transporter n=1 Tax=Clostridium bovifaecis TaxID=2184719 RepID=A0A6I6ETB6_9CLOT|nr:GerAB/ArcD/ProY family transporter [Clostridium bovifaecis]
MNLCLIRSDFVDKLSSRHFIFIILGTSIVSYKTYPNILIRYGRRDSWISVLIASILIILYISYILKVFTKTKCYNLYEIYTSALGKTFGDILFILFAFTLFLTLVESASMEANSMHQNMILETPPWYILLFFIITTAYCVKRALGRS